MEVIMMIGMPGSGKSTVAAELLKQNPNAVLICPDQIRKEFYGDIAIAGNSSDVFAEVDRLAQNACYEGHDVIYDATNTNHRGSYINKFRAMGFSIITGIFVDTPIEECKRRNLARHDRFEPVPDEVIERMANNLKKNPPSLKDGFDIFETRGFEPDHQFDL